MQNHTQEDLRAYRFLGLTVLQLMALLSVTGLVLAFLAHHFI